jgi:hypothetical protein
VKAVTERSRRNAGNQLALWISNVAHPFATVTLLVAVLAIRQPYGHATQSVLLVVIVVLLPVAVLMFRQVRRKRWSNADASNPSERPVLFLTALGGVVASLSWLRLKDPHSFLMQGMFVIGMFLLLAALLTRWIKLSLHVAFAALTATTLSLIGSWVGYLLIAVVPLVFWSRLALARHRLHELAVGLALGAFTGFLLVHL